MKLVPQRLCHFLPWALGLAALLARTCRRRLGEELGFRSEDGARCFLATPVLLDYSASLLAGLGADRRRALRPDLR